MPCDYKKYPANWFSEIRPAILKRACNCCEGIDRFPNCFAINGEDHPDTGSRVVLTIAHMNHDTGDNRPENLRALCQRCHNTHDAAHRAGTKWRKQYAGKGQEMLNFCIPTQSVGTTGG